MDQFNLEQFLRAMMTLIDPVTGHIIVAKTEVGVSIWRNEALGDPAAGPATAASAWNPATLITTAREWTDSRLEQWRAELMEPKEHAPCTDQEDHFVDYDRNCDSPGPDSLEWRPQPRW